MKPTSPQVTTPSQPRQDAVATSTTTPRRRHPKIAKRPTLNRSHVAAGIATVLKVSANKSRQILDVVLDVIKLQVRNGHAVELRGFCKFEVRNVKARSRVDMKDVKAGRVGAEVGRIEVPAHATVKAVASPVFLGGAKASTKAGK